MSTTKKAARFHMVAVRRESKCAEFRAWLDEHDHEWQENDPDAFRAAFKQTGCRTVMLTINKK